MKIIDLFCKAGGASVGLKQAFPSADIIGVDIISQPNYPFTFIQANALEVSLEGADFIWASPPCQAHTVLRNAAWDKAAYKTKHLDLIPQIRQRLQASGCPYIIENVPGAPLEHPILLCGSHFQLQSTRGHQLRRHRLFECSFDMPSPGPCQHKSPTIGIFGNKARNTAAEKRHYSKPKETRGVPPKDILLSLADARSAMGVNYMSFAELSEAIPPAYANYLATYWRKLVGRPK